MAQALSHNSCAFYTVVSDSDASQLIICGLTGERVSVDRSLEMIANNKYYQIEYKVDGENAWAYIDDHILKKRLWLSDLGFRKTVVKNAQGRLAIQDKQKEHKPYWADSPEHMNHKTVKTVVLDSYKKLGLVFNEFHIERGILESAMSLPHRIGGRLFWEIRCLQAGLDLSCVDDDNRRTWTKRNFWNASRQWTEHFRMSGGMQAEAHWLRSCESWRSAQEAFQCV